ncbi:MAG: TolC family protein [Bacteroidales bacterium]|nr:TolC family protein [Bacteroidales bacterium]
MKKTIVQIFVWIWILAGSMAAQENETALNLSQLLDRSLQNNYLLQANQKNTLVKQAEIEILKTNYLPTISASASFSYWKFLITSNTPITCTKLERCRVWMS